MRDEFPGQLRAEPKLLLSLRFRPSYTNKGRIAGSRQRGAAGTSLGRSGSGEDERQDVERVEERLAVKARFQFMGREDE